MVKVYQENEKGVTTYDYIHTEKNLAGPFTKGLSHNMIDVAFKEMSLRPT
jgi:hypothetical protein